MHRWVDHAAELELELEATSERGVFEEALAALGGLLAERTGGEEEADAELARQQVSASAPDRATLLAEWLSELAYLAESEGFVPRRVERMELTGNARGGGRGRSPGVSPSPGEGGDLPSTGHVGGRRDLARAGHF